MAVPVNDTGGDGVRVSVADGLLHLVIDRPDRKNSLTPGGILRLVRALEDASTDDTVRAVYLTGEGPDFCAGADWVSRNDDSGDKPRTGSIQRRTPLQAHRLIALLCEIQLPVVCAVRGWAAGLGCQLALASDFTIVAADSRFWLPFVERGFTPDSGSSWLVARLVGVARAKAMLMAAEPVGGAQAAEWGLVHDAVADAALDEAARELVDRMASTATVAVGLTKRLVHRGLTGDLASAMEAESQALELSSRTGDFREGLDAFRERRSPNFTGR